MKRFTFVFVLLALPTYVMSMGWSSYRPSFGPVTPSEQSYTYNKGQAKITQKIDSKQTVYIQTGEGKSTTCTQERNDYVCEVKTSGRLVQGKYEPSRVNKFYAQQAASEFKKLKSIFKKAKAGKL